MSTGPWGGDIPPRERLHHPILWTVALSVAFAFVLPHAFHTFGAETGSYIQWVGIFFLTSLICPITWFLAMMVDAAVWNLRHK